MEKPSKTQGNIVGTAKPRKGWLYITGIVAISGYAAVLIPAFFGQSVKPELGYGLMFWSGFFLLLVESTWSKSWHGGLHRRADQFAGLYCNHPLSATYAQRRASNLNLRW